MSDNEDIEIEVEDDSEEINIGTSDAIIEAVSPRASVEKNGSVTTLTVTDIDGTTTADINDGVSPEIDYSDDDPIMDGTASAGVEDKVARADHVHPSDTTKVDKVVGKDLSTNDYTDADKSKLDGIESGAEVNQNAFGNIKVDNTTIEASSETDTLELEAGSNITLTPDDENKKVVIESTGGGDVTDVEVDGTSVVTGGVAEIDLTGKADTSSLAAVATSGDYTDLDNTPSLATVATTGDYGDLDNTPSLATVATTGDYDDLTDTPTIPTVNDATLTIQKNGTDVQTFSANASSNATANITVPTQTSDLVNNSLFLRGDTAGVYKGNSTTSGSTGTKDVTCSNFTSSQLQRGVLIMIDFNHDNSASVDDLKLNVNSTGAKPIRMMKNGHLSKLPDKSFIQVTMTYPFYYDGDYWVCIVDNTPTKTSQLTNDSNYVSDASYVHTDNNFTNALKTALENLDDDLGDVSFGVNTITAGQTSGMVTGHVYAYSAYDAVTGETLIIDAKHTQTNPPYTEFSIASAYSNNIVVLYIKGA